jgi:hypothetical protein
MGRIYDNDTTSNIVNDSRIAVGDQGVLLGDGATYAPSTSTDSNNTITTTNTTNTTNNQNIQTTNTSLTDSYNTTTNNQNIDSRNLSQTNSNNTTTTTNTQHITNTTVDPVALSQLVGALPTITGQSAALAGRAIDGVFNTLDDLAQQLDRQSEDQSTFATTLVDRVLKETRTGDERQTENFLTTTKQIVGFVMLAVLVVVIAPRFAKG